MTLKIARGFSLDDDVVTQTVGILAQRRKGKTYTASVIAEEMVAAGIPWVVLDPTGAWWGLRAGKDGRRAGGLPVYVFGGDHGDLPLERGSGAQIADLVVEHPRWYVLDLSHFESKEAEREFATAFAERFYRRKGKAKAPMHLFIDEADVFVPQQSPSGDKRMLGAFESIVRRGGIRGIGTTLISQRAAVVNKNVLEQIDTLVVLRIVGPNDRKAIRAYVDAHGTAAEVDELLGSLAGLDLGEAWFYTPGGDVFRRVQVRERRTFNSSATPDGGDRQEVALADVDLDALRDQLAGAIAKAKATDPKALQKRIDELELELRRETAAREILQRKAPETRTEVVEVQTVSPELVDGLEAIADRICEEQAATFNRALDPLLGLIADAKQALGRVQTSWVSEAGRKSGGRAGSAGGMPGASRSSGEPATTVRASDPAPTPTTNGSTAGQPTQPQQRILDALAWMESVGVRPVQRTQLALLAGASPKSSGYANNLGALRSAGLVDYPGDKRVGLTSAGQAAANVPEAPPTNEDLWATLAQQLRGAKWALLQQLIERYPADVGREELADLVGASASSSGYANNLGALRSLGFLDYPAPGRVIATQVLFIDTLELA